MSQAKAEAKTKALRLRPRPKFWPRGQSGLKDLTSLVVSLFYFNLFGANVTSFESRKFMFGLRNSKTEID